MARVIVILSLMVAVTAGMFALTRKSAVAPGEAANGPSATVKLPEVLPAAAPAAPAAPAAAYGDSEETSLITADPRPLTNAAGRTSAPQDVTAGPVAGAAPSIATAGIDHKRRVSFTGTATPGDTVSLYWGDKSVGKTTVDRDGNWEVGFKVPKVLTAKELYVSATTKDGSTIVGPKRATIEPPSGDSALPRITLKSQDDVTPPPAATGDGESEPTTGIVVEKVANGDAGVTVLTGKADPGAQVSAAINGTTTAEAKVLPDGSWKLEAPNLSGKSAETVRIELRDAAGNTLDHTELPYKVEAPAPVADPKPKADFPAVLTSNPGSAKKPKNEDLAALFQPPTTDVDKPKRKIIRVRKGDSLWRISRRHLGNGKKWASFYKLNKKKIDNPNLIFPGQTLIIPG